MIARETHAGTDILRRPGAGLATVLLHGIGSDAQTWRAVMEALPGPVLAWDAPGYGASLPVSPASPVPADYAARLAAVLDAMGIDQVVLVGHSLGALFAGSFAVAHPARVAALALLSPALGYAVPPGAALPGPVQARIDDLTALGPAEFAARRAGRLVARPQALAGVQRAMAGLRPDGYAQAVRALGAGDLVADAPRISAATLVGVGELDVVTPPAGAHRLHAALRHPLGAARLLPGCGHALPQEAPAELAALLLPLLVETAHVG